MHSEIPGIAVEIDEAGPGHCGVTQHPFERQIGDDASGNFVWIAFEQPRQRQRDIGLVVGVFRAPNGEFNLIGRVTICRSGGRADQVCQIIERTGHTGIIGLPSERGNKVHDGFEFLRSGIPHGLKKHYIFQIDEGFLGHVWRIVWQQSDPRSTGRALTGPLRGAYWRYRVGDYRIICDIQDEVSCVLVIEIGHRKGIYR